MSEFTTVDNKDDNGVVVVNATASLPSSSQPLRRSSYHDDDDNDAVGDNKFHDVMHDSQQQPLPPPSSPLSSSSSSSFSFSILWHQLTTGFTSLQNSPTELYLAYILKFLDSYSYFSFSMIMTLFLSEDFGFNDVKAGTLYGLYGALATVYGLLTGFIVDNIGVAKSLRLGYAVALLGRLGIFMTTSRTILVANILLTLPFGLCLGIPVLTTGIRRYTNEHNRGFAFGLFYVVMNVAALMGGPIVDILTIFYKDSSVESTTNDNNNNGTRSIRLEQNEGDETPITIVWTLSSYRAIILSGIVANIIACIVTFWVREIKVHNNNNNNTVGDNVDDSVDDNTMAVATTSTATITKMDDHKHTATAVASVTTAIMATTMDDEPASMVIPPSPSSLTSTVVSRRTNSNTTSNVATFRPLTGSPIQILRETCRSPSFRRFLVVCLIMLNVRMVFRHLDATLPKYMIREFGTSVPKGTIYSINPALIIILVPIVTATTSHINPLIMMHYGSYISAASVFALAISTSIPACIVFVTVLSIGEAIWSPRLYDYSVSVCREGREGTYMALTSAPLFLAKLPVGYMSGYLLQKYCPEDIGDSSSGDGDVTERHSRIMWLIIGLVTATSPICMTCFWGYISKKPNDDDEEESNGIVNYTELPQQHHHHTTSTSSTTTTTTRRQIV